MRRSPSGVERSDVNAIGEYAQLHGWKIGLMDAANRKAYFVDGGGVEHAVLIGQIKDELSRAEGGSMNGKNKGDGSKGRRNK